MHIPIPEGLQLPSDASTKPFKLNGLFIAMGDKLMPLELDGNPIVMPEHESEEGEEDEGEEYGGCGGDGECEKGGGKKRTGEMHGVDEMESPKNKGNSFVVAIERSMKR